MICDANLDFDLPKTMGGLKILGSRKVKYFCALISFFNARILSILLLMTNPIIVKIQGVMRMLHGWEA